MNINFLEKSLNFINQHHSDLIELRKDIDFKVSSEFDTKMKECFYEIKSIDDIPKIIKILNDNLDVESIKCARIFFFIMQSRCKLPALSQKLQKINLQIDESLQQKFEKIPRLDWNLKDTSKEKFLEIHNQCQAFFPLKSYASAPGDVRFKIARLYASCQPYIAINYFDFFRLEKKQLVQFLSDLFSKMEIIEVIKMCEALSVKNQKFAFYFLIFLLKILKNFRKGI